MYCWLLLQIYLCYLWLVLWSRVRYVCHISVKLLWNIVYCENAVPMNLTWQCVSSSSVCSLCLRSITSNCSFYDWQVRRLAPGWHVEAEQKQQGVEVRMEWNPTGCRCKSAGACLREWRVGLWSPAGGCGWCGKACRCGSNQRNIIHPNLKICWKFTHSQARCRWVCFFIRTDLEKLSFAALAHQWILCSEWVPSEWESKQLIKTSQ